MHNEDRIPNRLIKAKSPYLRQHAYNPVDWHPWGEEALALAQKEDKPIIVSIGYAACHWCHVMERESFEDDALAALMNKHFVCIKVDREERPDIDQVYMEAVQMMGGNGGWPLNVFLTPDTRPFYGGTYFQPSQWEQLLKQIAKVFVEKREEVEKSAEELTNGLNQSEVQRFSLHLPQEPSAFSMEEFQSFFKKMQPRFDLEWGGMSKAPKFPMPSIYLFLLRYWNLTKDNEALQHTCQSLNYMYQGGIYDQLGGGFARYSVDKEWFAPHFEKMLYDNAQLIAVYAEAYAITGSVEYKRAVYQSIAFIKREMTSPEGGFYAALDADSEGEEGKYYVWEASELKKLLGEDYPLFAAYYQVQEQGNWEHGRNILHRGMSNQAFARQYQLSQDTLQMMLEKWQHILMNERQKRIRPSLDNKVLTSWNALMIHGLCVAYRTFGEQDFLDIALNCAQFIEHTMRNGDQLWHSAQDGEPHLQGYLEDYASLIQAYISLYQCSFDERYLLQAKADTAYVWEHFYDKKEGFFFFTDSDGEALIARKKELFDSVIPSSNAIMAHNLHWLGILFDWKEATELSQRLLQQAQRLLVAEPHYLSYWACLYAYQLSPSQEICLVGEGHEAMARELLKDRYLPHTAVLGTKQSSELPLMAGRTAINGEVTIYVCEAKACKLPVHSLEEAWELLGS